MKHYFKKLPVFLYICLALLAYSCTYEKEFVNERNHEEVTVKRISFDDFSKNTLALAKLNQVKNKEIQLNRVIYDSINDFYINTDYGIYVQKGDKYSFTFAIYRDVYNGKTENLVLSSKDDGSFDSKMIEYDITAYEKELINSGEFVDLINKMEVFDFVSGKMFFDPGCYIIDIVETQNYCSGDGHSWDERYQCDIFLGNVSGTPPSVSTFTTVVDFSQCIQSGGGGENSGGTGVGASGGNGLLTTPVTCGQDCIIADAAINPCDKIKNLFISLPSLRNELVLLDGKTSELNEHGIYKLSTSSVIQTPPLVGNGILIFPNPPINSKYVMLAHTHNSPSENTYSIFGWDDIESMAYMLNSNKLDATKFVSFLMTSDGTRYAYTIDNVASFSKFFAYGNNPLYNQTIADKRVEIMKKFYTDPLPIIIENSNDLIFDEKAFLNMLNESNMGITLFEVDPTFTIFEKVSREPLTGDIVKTPCNN